MISGTIASQGLAYGQAYIVDDRPMVVDPTPIGAEEIAEHLHRFRQALQEVTQQIVRLRERAAGLLDEDKQTLFDGYTMLLEDPELQSDVADEVHKHLLSAEAAVAKVFERQAQAIAAFEDPYLRERASDVKDLGQRIVRALKGMSGPDSIDFEGEVVLIASDLTPAQAVQLDLGKVVALVTDHGGETSHTSILARSLGIPAIVGTKTIMQTAKPGDWVLVDAVRNQVLINPEPRMLEEYNAYKVEKARQKLALTALRDVPASTADGHRVMLAANISLPGEVTRVIEQRAEGVGLFRSEFLFLDRRSLPSEEQQFQAYKAVLQAMGDKPVVIRTMDIGGDKALPYLKMPVEQNPFLGCRGIRIGLRHPELLLTQMRSLLRASAFGTLHIMFPMISSLEEILTIKNMLQTVRAELAKDHVAFDEHVKIGIMVETPAAVFIADKLAKHVDFFSIGTNDLTQYILAVDRGQSDIAFMYQPLSPAVLIAIGRVIEVGRAAGTWVSVCGELAAHPQASQILVGFGVNELSMGAGEIPKVKQILAGKTLTQLQELAKQVVQCNTVAEVQAFLKKSLPTASQAPKAKA